MKDTPIFNPQGTDALEERKIWFGNTTNLMNLNNVKYKWGYQLYTQMRENFWIPEKYDVTQDVTSYGNLTNGERRAFNGVLSYLTFLDSVQSCNIPHLKTPITAPEISLCLSEQLSQECFDDQTEVLTIRGWKKFSEVGSTDLVAQYSLSSKEINYTLPSRIVRKKYEGVMLHFESQRTDIKVTPNHDMITILRGKPSKRLAKDVTCDGNYQYPRAGMAQFKAGVTDYMRLLVAVAADGSIRELPNGTYVQMVLTKQRKIERVTYLLEACGIEFCFTSLKGREGRRISFYLKDRETVGFVKDLSFLLVNTDKEILNELTFFDGSDGRFFYSTNKQAIDKVQLIALHNGINATIGINRTSQQALDTPLPQGGTPVTARTCYVVYLSDAVNTSYTSEPSLVDYDGYVYCVTVPTGNIVTRRNDKVAIQGNCLHNHAYQVMIEAIIPSSERNAVYDFWRTDKVLFERCEYIAKLYQRYIDDPSNENYYIALVADYLLEGLYFYNGLN